MNEILAVIGNTSMILGALVFATAALGVVRFPDAYTRTSAVGTAAGVGIVLVVLGAFLLQPTIPDLVKVIIIITLQLTTSAIGSMTIARSAYLTRTPLLRCAFDELAEEENPAEGRVAGKDRPTDDSTG